MTKRIPRARRNIVAPPAPPADPDRIDYRSKLRGHKRLKAIRMLAAGEHTQGQIAELLGVTQQAISLFAKREAEAVVEVQKNLDDEFAGLWIAQKENRIAEYEALMEDLATADHSDPAVVRAKALALKSVAEELGHLPGRLTVSGQLDTQTRYTINGVDPEAMR